MFQVTNVPIKYATSCPAQIVSNVHYNKNPEVRLITGPICDSFYKCPFIKMTFLSYDSINLVKCPDSFKNIVYIQ